MVSSQTNSCLEPEVLAAYVDHGLSLAERSRVDAHLASCPHCIAMVAGVVRTVEAVSEFMPAGDAAVEATSRVDRRSVAGMLTAAAAVFVVLAAPSLVGPWLDRDTGLVSLADSVEGERSVLGRLTGGFPHAPLGVPSAGGQGGRAAEADRLVLAAAKIRESFGERETPSRLHALGVQQLLARRYDDAAASLLAAAREQPNNARYLSDVAAVQLERARLGLRPDDLPRALAAADRARRLDPSLLEAWFNRALATTSLSLNSQAKQAWTEYLARDNASPWATEARRRLDELSKPTPATAWAAIQGRLHGPIDATLAEEAVRTQMTEARQFVETELLAEWASSVRNGNDASRELDRLRVMADAFLLVSGDALYRDAVAAIDRADARSTAAVAALARAHLDYVQAATIFAHDRFADAAPALTSARAALTAADTRYAHRASLDLGAVAYFRGQADEATRLLGELQQIARAFGYPQIGARVTWQLALIAFGQGRLGDAQAHYEETLAEYERIGDKEQIAAAHNLLASFFGYLGDETLEWRHRRETLEGLSITRSPRLRYLILVGAASGVRRQDPEAALVFQDAVIDSAKAWGREGAIAESLSQRATILAGLGRDEGGRQDLSAARVALQRVTDSALRQRIEVGVLAAESDLVRKDDPQIAVTAATRAIALVTERQDRRRLAQLNLRLAKANIVWGRLGEAQLALDRGIQAFEDERASLSDEGRISTLDESWQLFETSVHLSIKSGNYHRAFQMAERARMRTLAESKRSGSPLPLSEIQRTLDADQAVLALNQFDDELALWVIRRDKIRVITRPLTRRDASRLIARQQDEIWHEAATATAGRELYNEIMRPVLTDLQSVSRLVIVPDATYEDAAFAALWNSSRNRFLIEEVTLTMSPSVTSYVGALAEARTAERIDQPLILGGPEQGADAGARATAMAYRAPTLLTGSSATKTRFFADASGRSVVHVSAKTTSNPAFPLLSRMLLADDANRRHSGAILGRDIAARSMSRTNLVVIDEVEANPSDRGEGTLSLARAFMAAGVPAVVGTLPGASETATRDLMVGFHRRLASGMLPAEALTDLQRNVLQSNGRRLGAWSALVMYGSDR